VKNIILDKRKEGFRGREKLRCWERNRVQWGKEASWIQGDSGGGRDSRGGTVPTLVIGHEL